MNKNSKKIDIYTIALLTELFVLVCILFLSYSDTNNINVYIITSLSFFCTMITYAGGMIIGLISTSITIFLYSLYIFYNNMMFNTEISYIYYIWMIILMMITFTTGKLSEKILKLQEKNQKLESQYNELVTIDQTTGLGNIKNFYKYLDKDISIAKRHKVDLCLMIVNIPHYSEIKGMVGERNYDSIIKKIGDIITDSTRTEDDIYSLNNDMLAIIMIGTNNQGALVVKNRIKDRFVKLNLDIKELKYSVNIDVKVAVLEYNDSIPNSVEYKKRCEEELEYDV